MKARKLIILFLVCVTFVIKAQTDTVYVVKYDTVFVETEKDSRYSMYLESAETNTGRLWKVNFADLALFRLNAGLEYRLGENWSSDSYLAFGFGFGSYEIAINADDINETFGNSGWDFEQDLKYYYNLNRRIMLGKNANGFRGNSLALSFKYNNVNYNDSPTDPGFTWKQSENIDLGLKYSIQRRYADVVYIELFGGVYHRWNIITLNTRSANSDGITYANYVVVSAGIRIGLGFSSLKDLKTLFPY